MASYTLAEPTQAWIDAQVAAGRAPSAEAYLADLVARDREQAEKQATFDAAIREGFESGFVELTVDAVFDGIRQRRAPA